MKSTRSFALFTILIFCILVIFREPAYFIHPRIWAEEGTVYIQSYLDSGPWISFISPHLGYYSLFDNLAVNASLWMLGLVYVAAGTTAFSLVVMCLALFSPYILPSRYWDTEPKRSTVVLLSLVIGSDAIWLNTINAQFYLCLFSVYVLLAETNALRRKTVIYCSTMLFVASLTGVTSIILLPYFGLKLTSGFRFRKFHESKNDWTFLLILLFGFLIQIAAFYISLKYENINRFDSSNLVHLPHGFGYSILSAMVITNAHGLIWNIIGGICLINILYLYYRAIKDSPETRYLMSLIIYLSFTFAVLSVGMSGGARYAYPISVLVIILLVNQAAPSTFNQGLGISKTSNKAPYLSRIAVFTLLCIAAIKIPNFFYTGNLYDQSWNSYYSQARLAVSGKQDYIGVFPQGPGQDWRISLANNNQYLPEGIVPTKRSGPE